ncbi:hypothetical protein [Legionella saoudiensis]|uniref:hypothetical protein n=1 Tax=Legionella saoudiensis TaxID=1750561 RepID=UPI00073169B9|nr:hypothetical protein [Legionella saoudiensis]
MAKPLRQQHQTNNYFLLQCMAGITAAALAATAIAALAVLKFGATAATAAGLAATNMMFASTFAAASPILPMFIMGAIGAVFLLALLGSCGGNSNTTVRVVPNGPTYGGWGSSFWSRPTVHVHHTGHHHGGRVHHDGRQHVDVPNGPLNGFPPSNGNVHHHPGGNMSGHFPSGNTHSHGGPGVVVHNQHGTTHNHRM